MEESESFNLWIKESKGKVQKEHGENNNYKIKFSSFKDHILKIEFPDKQ